MKKIHSTGQDIDQISVFIGTWNMGDSAPIDSLEDWLRCQGIGRALDPHLINMLSYDLYVIGTQESGMSEKDWINLLKTTIHTLSGTELYTVASCSLWGIRLVILSKTEHKNSISHIQQSTVRTGIANTLGNKGGVGISLHFNGTSFCFINCHLTSGHEKNHRRNKNVSDILKGLTLGPKHLNMFDLNIRFHHVFWLGDLNYRLDSLDIYPILEKVTSNDYETLLDLDQLKRSKDTQQVFIEYNETEITFPPTYRYAKGTPNQYNWKKIKKTGERINVPSWCDRVLWRSYPNSFIQSNAYGCVTSVSNSDHKPVFSAFDVGIISQSSKCSTDSCLTSNPEIVIKFESIEAEVKTSTRQEFILEFSSTCLEGAICSLTNSADKADKAGYCSPVWSKGKNLIPLMSPIGGDVDYLEDQHMLIALKTSDGLEYYGECVLSLKNKYSDLPKIFQVNLQHQGEMTGSIKGMMHFTSPSTEHFTAKKQRRQSKKSYELVYMDTEFHGLTVDPTLPTTSQGSPSSSPVTQLVEQVANIMSPTFKSPKQQQPDDEPETETYIYGHTYESPWETSEDQEYTSLPEGSMKSVLTNNRNQHESLTRQWSTGAMDQVSRSDNNTGREPPHPRARGIKENVVNVSSTYTSIRKLKPNEDKPVAPPRRSVPKTNNQESKSVYEPLVRTISEWLLTMGLPQYISKFMGNGWDEMAFLKDLTKHDLIKMGITNGEHITKILNNASR